MSITGIQLKTIYGRHEQPFQEASRILIFDPDTGSTLPKLQTPIWSISYTIQVNYESYPTI